MREVQPNVCFSAAASGTGFGSSRADTTVSLPKIPDNVECIWKAYTEAGCPEDKEHYEKPGLKSCVSTVFLLIFEAGRSYKWECKMKPAAVST